MTKIDLLILHEQVDDLLGTISVLLKKETHKGFSACLVQLAIKIKNIKSFLDVFVR